MLLRPADGRADCVPAVETPPSIGPTTDGAVLVIGPINSAQTLRDLLAPRGLEVVARPPGDVPDGLTGYTAVVLDGRDDAAPILAACRRLALRPAEDRPPLVMLTPDDDPRARLAAFDAGADIALPRSATPDELAAQLRALDRWQRVRGHLRDRAAEAQLFNQRLQQAYRQIDLDLELARRLQASFLPRTFPEVGPVRFAVCYRPCGQVGGDFYDVFRLDEHHVGFYVADAMGHGLPASLLTIFLKRAVQAKEVTGTSYRLVPPREVLARLNRELIAQGLAELPFITMIYGLLDCRDGRLEFARAAHPHPLHLPHAGPPERWQTPGTLLGIFEADYPPLSRRLGPGDKLLLFTDGVANNPGPDDQGDPLAAAADRHRGLPVETFVERLAQELAAGNAPVDDVTLLGVEVLPVASGPPRPTYLPHPGAIQ
jgi:serine phosphatase RsbU (regulator of sigma subunit)